MTKDKCILIFEYILCFFIILSCRTVYIQSSISHLADGINMAVIVAFLILILLRCNGKIKVKTMWFILSYLIYAGIYFVMAVKNDSFSFIMKFFLMLPLCLLYLSFLDHEAKKVLLKRYAKIIIVLASISLLFYLFGSCLNFVKPNMNIRVEWGGEQLIDGYFGVHFNAQHTNIFGLTLLRNTGLFVEGPMYSLQLILAYAFILFQNKKMLNKVSIILGITLVTSLSVTGIVAFLILSFYKYIKVNNSKTKIITIPLVAVIGLILSIGLYQDKQETSSYRIRNDDIAVTMMSFKNNPLFGDGFMNNDVAISNMSSFRLYNTGLSSTFSIVLIHGGMYLSILYTVPMIMMLNRSRKLKDMDTCIIGILQFILYFTATFQYTTLMMLLIAFNIDYVLYWKKIERRNDNEI